MSKQFDYKEIDQEGLENLDVIAEAEHFNRWMYEQIKPHCTGTILEIGSGIGNISQFLLGEGKSLYVSDIRQVYRERLEHKFKDVPNLKGVLDMDIVSPDFEQRFRHMFSTFDTIFALNVVEHIENDSLATANCKKLLKPGGKLIILVPAYQALYNQFDKELYHYRRYTKATLNKLFNEHQLPIVETRYFNALGILG